MIFTAPNRRDGAYWDDIPPTASKHQPYPYMYARYSFVEPVLPRAMFDPPTVTITEDVVMKYTQPVDRYADALCTRLEEQLVRLTRRSYRCGNLGTARRIARIAEELNEVTDVVHPDDPTRQVIINVIGHEAASRVLSDLERYANDAHAVERMLADVEGRAPDFWVLDRSRVRYAVMPAQA